MDVAGINQHGKITISLGTGDVATLKGDWDETSTAVSYTHLVIGKSGLIKLIPPSIKIENILYLTD